jgi:leucyl-tRNA synthetase
VEGVHRFLARTYRAFEAGLCDDEPSKEQLRLLHITIKKVTTETEEMRFNTVRLSESDDEGSGMVA